MDKECEKPTFGFWVTIALVTVLVAYPLSFGPACWLVSCDGLPRLGTARFYRPIVCIANAESRPVSEILRWYAGHWDAEIAACEVFDVSTSTAAEMGWWLELADSPPCKL